MINNTTEKKFGSIKRGPDVRFTDTVLNKKYVSNPDVEGYNEDFMNFVEEEGRVCRLRLFEESDLQIDESKQKKMIPNFQDDDQKSTYMQVATAIRQNEKDVLKAIMNMEKQNSKSFNLKSQSVQVEEKIKSVDSSYEVIPHQGNAIIEQFNDDDQ